MRQILRSVLLLIAGIIIGLHLVSQPPRREDGDPPRAPTHLHVGPTLEQIRGLAELVTTQVHIANVQQTRIDGYSGGITAVLLVKGDYRLTIDLSRGVFEAVDPIARSAVLLLPPPQVSSPRVDHERTRLIAVTPSGLWHLVPGERAHLAVVNQALRQAQQIITTAAADAEAHEHARAHAQRVLACFFEALGWRVTIRWQRSPPARPTP